MAVIVLTLHKIISFFSFWQKPHVKVSFFPTYPSFQLSLTFTIFTVCAESSQFYSSRAGSCLQTHHRPFSADEQGFESYKCQDVSLSHQSHLHACESNDSDAAHPQHKSNRLYYKFKSIFRFSFLATFYTNWNDLKYFLQIQTSEGVQNPTLWLLKTTENNGNNFHFDKP